MGSTPLFESVRSVTKMNSISVQLSCIELLILRTEMEFKERVLILHWLPNEDRWESISWNDWVAFRGVFETGKGLARISGGIHHFVVCVPDDDGIPVNLIPHKYLVEPDGTIGYDNFPGLTREERMDYSRIMSAVIEGPNDRELMSAIRNKMGATINPPKASAYSLIRAIQKSPIAGSAAEDFLREMLV